MAMLDSRKWRATLLATGLLMAAPVLTFVLVLTGHANMDAFARALTTSTGGVGATFIAYVLGVAMEDSASKRSNPITAGGDVVLTNNEAPREAVVPPLPPFPPPGPAPLVNPST